MLVRQLSKLTEVPQTSGRKGLNPVENAVYSNSKKYTPGPAAGSCPNNSSSTPIPRSRCDVPLARTSRGCVGNHATLLIEGVAHSGVGGLGSKALENIRDRK